MRRQLLAMTSLSLVLAASTAGSAAPVDVCGTVEIGGLNCLTIRTDASAVYLPVPRPTGVEAGTRVRLVGSTDTCSNFCGIPTCVTGAQVSPCTPSCRADFDQSGALGVQDIFTFLAAYFAQIPGASPPGGDFDQNGTLTVGDIFAFLAAYFTGCP
jgi:hypothetical protein